MGFSWIFASAFAGNLEIVVETPHGSMTTELHEVATCTTQSIQLDDFEGNSWRVQPTVVPDGDQLRIDLDVQHRWKDGEFIGELHAKPTLVVASGKTATVQVQAHCDANDCPTYEITLKPTRFGNHPLACEQRRASRRTR